MGQTIKKGVPMSRIPDSGSLDERKLNQMKVHILTLEQNNLNTGEKTNDAMVDIIRQTIISIAEKAY